MSDHSMVLHVDPPYHLSSFTIREYVAHVHGVYLASWFCGEYRIKEIHVDARGPGAAVLEVLRNELGDIVQAKPYRRIRSFVRA